MALGDQSIHRFYNCTNKECETQISFKEKVSDKWRKKCPFCHKHSLVLFRANMNLGALVDTKKPKTWGGISDQNRRRDEKETGEEKQIGPRKPFWRDKKINFNILKDPKKYVDTGAT